eukprot:15021340-Heterocapsa_arctica.AAC.1
MQVVRDSSMTSYMVFAKIMKINLNNYIMNESKNNIVVDKSDKTTKNLIWLFFDIFLPSPYFNLVL